MLILALDTSGKIASCAIAKDGAVVAEKLVLSELSHSKTLLPMCEEMLRENGFELSDFDLFAVTSGPGSFTGLRIGIAAVKGFAFAKDTPCVGVPTTLSAAFASRILNGTVCSAIRARENEYYAAFFKVKNGEISRLSEDEVISGDELIAKAETFGQEIYLCGEGSDGLSGFEKTGLKQSAAGTALAAFSLKPLSCHELVPSYLKPSQAERMKKEREKL